MAPDEKTFVFAAKQQGNWDIYSQRLGGRHVVNLTADFLGDDTQPAFSPEGDRLAFRSEREAGGTFIMGATCESVRKVAGFGYNPSSGSKRLIYSDDAAQPNWSPHGDRIAFWSGLSGRREVKTISSSGGEARPAANDADVNWNPVSPDG